MASSLRDAHPVAGSGNHLYILLMEEADSDIHKFPYSLQPPQGPHFSLGLLSSRPLPHKQVNRTAFNPHMFFIISHSSFVVCLCGLKSVVVFVGSNEQ